MEVVRYASYDGIRPIGDADENDEPALDEPALPPLPASCYGTVTGGSCRYEPCGSWRGGSNSVECSSAKQCVCKPGHCHDGKGRCVAIPAEAA